MGALSLDLADSLYEIDENIIVNPKKVSRIRRDTRFTKDKTLYRSNVWVIWHRQIDTDTSESAPGMWVEFGPDFYSYGIGFWRSTPAFMEFFRKDLRENPKIFSEALLKLVQDGFMYDSEKYKRERAGTEEVPEALREIYNHKDLFFLKRSQDVTHIASAAFVDEMKQAIAKMKDMYNYFDNLNKRFEALED
jgi:uncharacterized protein (DUF2461 family)